MSANWPRVPLGDVLTARTEEPDLDDLIAGRVRIVSKIGFEFGQIQFRDDGTTKTGMILARPGDLLVSGINATKGAIGLLPESLPGPVAATIHYSAYSLRDGRTDSLRYLWWLLRSAVFRNALVESLPSGIKTELKPSRFLKIVVPLPIPDGQRKIVGKVESIASKVSQAVASGRASAALSASLMESALTEMTALFPTLGRFEEVITFKPRSGPSFVTDPDWRGMPVLMPSAVTGFGVDPRKVEYGPGNEKVSQKDRLEPGDILIARGNKRDQVGNAGVVPNRAAGWVCANLLMRLQIDRSRVDRGFCIYWLRSPMMREHVRRSMTGTNPNIQKINQRVILNYPYPTSVPLRQQQQIVAHLDALQAKTDALRSLQSETAAELDALLPAVLAKAFAGEL